VSSCVDVEVQRSKQAIYPRRHGWRVIALKAGDAAIMYRSGKCFTCRRKTSPRSSCDPRCSSARVEDGSIQQYYCILGAANHLPAVSVEWVASCVVSNGHVRRTLSFPVCVQLSVCAEAAFKCAKISALLTGSSCVACTAISTFRQHF
jgi:hypothetical protein